MNKINYDEQAEKLMSEIIESGRKPKLLLHACCAPCASACIERVKKAFEVTAYFYNPNMDGKEEYARRAKELERLCKAFDIPAVTENFEPSEFYKAIRGYENASEGGSRCEKCFALRAERTAEFARQNGFDYFATTLTVSPLKNAEKVNAAGFSAGERHGVQYLPTDFKKRGGYLRSCELSREFGLYRQHYCGCEFSKTALERKEKKENL